MVYVDKTEGSAKIDLDSPPKAAVEEGQPGPQKYPGKYRKRDAKAEAKQEARRERSPKPEKELCKYVLRPGGCNKGEQCNYSHDLKSVPCKYIHS